MPNPELFPLANLEIGLKDGAKLDLSGKLLNTALQYSPSVRTYWCL